jgi:hypothetical protein
MLEYSYYMKLSILRSLPGDPVKPYKYNYNIYEKRETPFG